MLKTAILSASLAIAATAPSPPPPNLEPVTLTGEQVMTMRVAIEQLAADKAEAEAAMVFCYKKAQECKRKGQAI